MELRRTVPIKPEIMAEQANLLHETIEQFLWAANFVVDRAHQDDGYVLTDSGKLHERTYETVRTPPTCTRTTSRRQDAVQSRR